MANDFVRGTPQFPDKYPSALRQGIARGMGTFSDELTKQAQFQRDRELQRQRDEEAMKREQFRVDERRKDTQTETERDKFEEQQKIADTVAENAAEIGLGYQELEKQLGRKPTQREYMKFLQTYLKDNYGYKFSDTRRFISSATTGLKNQLDRTSKEKRRALEEKPMKPQDKFKFGNDIITQYAEEKGLLKEVMKSKKTMGVDESGQPIVDETFETRPDLSKLTKDQFSELLERGENAGIDLLPMIKAYRPQEVDPKAKDVIEPEAPPIDPTERNRFVQALSQMPEEQTTDALIALKQNSPEMFKQVAPAIRKGMKDVWKKYRRGERKARKRGDVKATPAPANLPSPEGLAEGTPLINPITKKVDFVLKEGAWQDQRK